ncbi:hypothetical protein PR202_gb19083 [Eleusine coracana subsp. coracana]|uniref:Uncharacterized protein n=1 Tax=Eleusine coracana subsp. coracana TaxID=191504 RepID=A0AAV5F527_ELECO|nr:hypothetical protein PR202_gb19083 [Eleusine coracana subsp. coracana]
MAAFWLLLLLLIAGALWALRSWRDQERRCRTSYPPGLRPYPLIGHLPQFVANRHRLLDWMTELLSRQPTCTFVLRRPGGVRGHPANVEHLLRGRFDNYPKGPRFASLLHDFLGRGVFNADGEAWRAQRKVASHEFNTRSLRAFVARCVHAELHGRLLPLLRRAAASSERRGLDLQDALERFAFDNICRVAFDHDPRQLPDDAVPEEEEEEGSRFADAFRDAANISAGRFRYAVPWFWRIKKALNFGSERRLRDSIAMVHDLADRIIQARREEMMTTTAGCDDEKQQDLLSRFMASQDETYARSGVPLRDVVISFLLAGRETTSSALTWFFWLLSSRPDVARRIRDEVAAVRARRATSGDGDQRNAAGFDLDELREMQYVHAAVTESMRLYPPVPVNALRAEADDVLPDGTRVHEGWFATCNAYAMGRMEAVWGADAGEYRPERWFDVDGAFRPESPFKYPVLHAGPRVCLGREMAYIQMKSIVACVMEEFDVVVHAAYQPRQALSLTLRMQDGLPVTVKHRRD